jgi:hypothetical protein
LCNRRPASQSVPELSLYHIESAFNITALMMVTHE